MEPWVEQAIYGMAAEAISNAIRHGSPRSIRVDLREVRNRAVVTIDDDGRGFDPGLVVRSASSGLAARCPASELARQRQGPEPLGGGSHVRISIWLTRHRRWTASGPSDGGPLRPGLAGDRARPHAREGWPIRRGTRSR